MCIRDRLILVVGTAVALTIRHRQVTDPLHLIETYYDDLDFRRFRLAYERLDPLTRPSYDQYLLEMSVTNGLVASYGKLDSVVVGVVEREPDRIVVEAESTLITALDYYTTVRQHVLLLRDGRWVIQPDTPDGTIPPDTFFRKGVVDWYAAGRRRVTMATTAFGDVLDLSLIHI